MTNRARATPGNLLCRPSNARSSSGCRCSTETNKDGGKTCGSLRLSKSIPRQDLWQSSLVKVYPKTLLDPLRVWAQHHPLIVKDRNGKLAAFLAQQAVTFRTRRFDTRTLSDVKPVYFVTGPDSSPLSNAASWNTEHINIVFFHERMYNISKIKSLNTKYGTRIDVEMKLLDKLMTDPLAQKVLLEIFRMSQNTTYTEEN